MPSLLAQITDWMERMSIMHFTSLAFSMRPLAMPRKMTDRIEMIHRVTTSSISVIPASDGSVPKGVGAGDAGPCGPATPSTRRK